MTYARARLLLGMFGVGSIVLLSISLLWSGLPVRLLPDSQSWSGRDLTALFWLFGCLIAILLPLDLVGGLLLPNRWKPNTTTIGHFLIGWVRGVLVQGGLFFGTSLIILFMGRWFGILGAAVAVAGIAIFLVGAQLQIAKFVGALATRSADLHEDHLPNQRGAQAANADRATDATQMAVMARALSLVSEWGWIPRPITVLKHHDTGFTGGIVGLPGLETVVLPAQSLDNLLPEQLAIVIARRLEAIQSGSRTRGLLLALGWVIVGFAFSAMLPGAGVTSVGQLAMTCLGFTLWTFFGLLTLPTLSRQAAYAIDGKVLKTCVSSETFEGTLKALDSLQDDEPNRPALIETIFHPVPSVDNRRIITSSQFPIAWHAARMTLFVSWACMGMLVRAVHCNVGRPELWVMLPTD